MPVLLALGGAFVVTFALVNLPGLRTLLHFGRLSAFEQVGILAYSIAYMVIANWLKRWSHRAHAHAQF